MAKLAPSPAKEAIQSDEQAGQESQEFLDFKAQIEALEAEKKALIATITQEIDNRLKPLVVERDERHRRVQAWCEATRTGRKTIKFPNGRQARWRTASSDKLVVGGTLETIIQSLLKRRDWKKFLKVELKKSSLAAHPKVVEETEGLSLLRGEYFSIN